jgi:hypothetical protein
MSSNLRPGVGEGEANGASNDNDATFIPTTDEEYLGGKHT